MSNSKKTDLEMAEGVIDFLFTCEPLRNSSQGSRDFIARVLYGLEFILPDDESHRLNERWRDLRKYHFGDE